MSQFMMQENGADIFINNVNMKIEMSPLDVC